MGDFIYWVLLLAPIFLKKFTETVAGKLGEKHLPHKKALTTQEKVINGDWRKPVWLLIFGKSTNSCLLAVPRQPGGQ